MQYNGKVEVPDGLEHARPLIESNDGFLAYSDSSWHKGDELGYSMFGYVVYMYGGPVAFAAKRLKVITLSSVQPKPSTPLHLILVKKLVSVVTSVTS